MLWTNFQVLTLFDNIYWAIHNAISRRSLQLCENQRCYTSKYQLKHYVSTTIHLLQLCLGYLHIDKLGDLIICVKDWLSKGNINAIIMQCQIM